MSSNPKTWCHPLTLLSTLDLLTSHFTISSPCCLWPSIALQCRIVAYSTIHFISFHSTIFPNLISNRLLIISTKVYTTLLFPVPPKLPETITLEKEKKKMKEKLQKMKGKMAEHCYVNKGFKHHRRVWGHCDWGYRRTLWLRLFMFLSSASFCEAADVWFAEISVFSVVHPPHPHLNPRPCFLAERF